MRRFTEVSREDQPLWPARSELEMSKLKEPWKQCGSIIMPLFKVNAILQGRLRLKYRLTHLGSWRNEWWNSNQTNEKWRDQSRVVDPKARVMEGIVTEQFVPVECLLGTITVLIVTYESTHSSYMQHLCKGKL